MSTTITATGDFHIGAAPTLTISAGRGNTPHHEIHLALRDDSDENSSKSIFAWFNRDELLDAITTEEERIRHALEIGEPA